MSDMDDWAKALEEVLVLLVRTFDPVTRERIRIELGAKLHSPHAKRLIERI